MADVTQNTGLAVFYASLAAGPIAMTVTVLMGQPITYVRDLHVIGLLISLLSFSVVSTLFALIPNLIGICVMGWLGSRNVGLRHPAIWALAGAAAAGIPTWLLVASNDGSFWTTTWAAIGALSALVARWAIWWE